MAVAAGAGAVLGGIAGGMSSGNLGQLSALGQQGQNASSSSLGAYQNLVNAGPGVADYTAGLQSQRDLASMFGNISSSNDGMYNFQAGNQLAAQSFAGQRQSLNTAFSDQLRNANRAASLSGRSTNDPILRARLAQEQTRQLAQLEANQSSSAVNFARQSVTDQIGNRTQQTNLLTGLGNQALTNQQNLFGMGQQALSSERNWLLQQAQNERAAGGGFRGALTGALGGASAGMQLAQGFGAMGNFGGSSAPMDAAGGTTGFSQDYLSGGGGGLQVTDMGYGGSLDAVQGAGAQVYGPPSPSRTLNGLNTRPVAPAVYGPSMSSPVPSSPSGAAPNWFMSLFGG